MSGKKSGKSQGILRWIISCNPAMSVSSLPPFSMGSPLKRENSLPQEQILSFKSRPCFARAKLSRDANGSRRVD